jgi:repressor LexA
MPNPLTDLERKVLDYLVEYLRTNTYQPSIREIGREFSIKSTKTVSELLQSLADKGWIERDPSRSRGVRLLGVELHGAALTVPFYDVVDSAEPASHFHLDRKLVSSESCFLVAMKGDHLAENSIRSGDLLLVEPTETEALNDGDIVLAVIGVDSTVRRFTRRAGEAVLEPSRPGEVALTLSPRQSSSILRGRVSAVLRRAFNTPADLKSPAAAISH